MSPLLPLVLSLSAPRASAAGCVKVSVADLAAAPSPSVLVLGERRGTNPDLARAAKIVGKLAARGPVTVALQAVDADLQPTLDAFGEGTVLVEALPAKLAWAERNGFPFDGYAKIFEQRSENVRFVGIGGPVALKPPEASFPLPPGYIAILADAMGDSPVPGALETTTVETVAWADHGYATRALAAWDGAGVLVILVDRLHVEGGLGVQWQAERLAQVPVAAAMLADGGSRCYAGDRLLP